MDDLSKAGLAAVRNFKFRLTLFDQVRIMNFKAVVVAVIFLLFGLPLLIRLFFWIMTSTFSPSPENIEHGEEILVESAIPWWICIIEWLAGLPGIIAALLIIGFIFFLKWIGEVR